MWCRHGGRCHRAVGAGPYQRRMAASTRATATKGATPRARVHARRMRSVTCSPYSPRRCPVQDRHGWATVRTPHDGVDAPKVLGAGRTIGGARRSGPHPRAPDHPGAAPGSMGPTYREPLTAGLFRWRDAPVAARNGPMTSDPSSPRLRRSYIGGGGSAPAGGRRRPRRRWPRGRRRNRTRRLRRGTPGRSPRLPPSLSSAG